MRRKWTVLFLAASFAAAVLGGCTAGQPSADFAETAETAPRIALVMGECDEWLSLLRDEVCEAAESAGYAIDVYDAAGDNVRQYDYVATAAQGDADVILINLSDSQLSQPLLEAANGKDVVFINREPEAFSQLGEHAVYVGSDETVSGAMQGAALAEYFRQAGKADIRYLLLKGNPALLHTTHRTESALAALEAGGIHATPACEEIVANYDRETASKQLEALLNAEAPSFDCIISNNDAMAFGAIAALEDAGIDPASIPIVGIDGVSEARECIREGTMLMSVYQSPEGQAEKAVEAAGRMVHGEPLTDLFNTDTPYVIMVPFEEIGQSDVTSHA